VAGAARDVHTDSMPIRRSSLVTLVFTGGPWNTECRQSDDPRPSLHVEGEGDYLLTDWRWSKGECRLTYTWRSTNPTEPGESSATGR
jgi:hypothetical protein